LIDCDVSEIFQKTFFIIEQRTLKNVNNCLNTDISSYLDTSLVVKVLTYF
jgi:hypothetical protein